MNTKKKPTELLKYARIQLRNDIHDCRIAFCILIPYLILTQLVFKTVCPFAILFGIPCPGCGLTRAGMALLTLQFETAWNYNPTIFLWCLLIVFFILHRYFFLQGSKLLLPLTVITTLVTFFVYIYRLATNTLVPVPFDGLWQIFLAKAH